MPFSSKLHPVVTIGILVSTLFTIPAQADRRLTIINSCPEAVPVYINGQLQNNGTPLASGQTVVRTFPDSWNGLVYTNANAPNSPGNSGVGTTRVGFENMVGYYYLIKDPEQFNTGVSVLPDLEAANGFCARVTCYSKFCANTHLDVLTQFPAPGDTPPAPPLFACPKAVGFTVRFCPSNAFPRTGDTVRFHPNGDRNRCLDAGASRTDGAAVRVSKCSSAASQQWRFTNSGPQGELTQVQAAGTGLCLDVGSGSARVNEADIADIETKRLRLRPCQTGSAPQAFIYNPRSQLLLEGTSECLALRGEADEVIQAISCVNTSSRQRWTVT